MKKIGTKKDCEGLSGLPPPVHQKIEETVALLNFYYGEMRDIDKDLGGYVLLIENLNDLEECKKIFSQDIETLIPEYTDIIRWKNKESYTSSPIQCSSDFSIVLLIPFSLTPKSFLTFLEGGENS